MKPKKRETFSFRSLNEFIEHVSEKGLDIPVSRDLAPLFRPVKVGAFTTPNALAVQPMEGCDSAEDGSPGPLTLRRYERISGGGAGLLWFEACAVSPEGRANPRQLYITPDNLSGFKELVALCRKTAAQTFGENHRPLFILQLTHSGRYSRPAGPPAPVITHHSRILDPKHALPPDYPLITDAELDRIQDKFLAAARLAAEAGFDGVDIKSCHRYLISELLASFTRENSRYGGSFENRTRMIREIMERLKQETPNLLACTRINAFDGIPRPYGWGTSEQDSAQPDLSEPLSLFSRLKEAGLQILNITIGNPYSNPHIGRPYDQPPSDAEPAAEPPIVGVERFINVVRKIQQHLPELPVTGGGYSWLRELFPHVAAGILEKNWATFTGLGRLAFAYPDFAKDLMETGRLDPGKVCIACSKCTQIMRDNGRTGCVVRDTEVYGPIYKQGRKQAKQNA